VGFGQPNASTEPELRSDVTLEYG